MFVINASRSAKGKARLSSASARLVPMVMLEVVYCGETLCSRSRQTEDKSKWNKERMEGKMPLINVIAYRYALKIKT